MDIDVEKLKNDAEENIMHLLKEIQEAPYKDPLEKIMQDISAIIEDTFTDEMGIHVNVFSEKNQIANWGVIIQIIDRFDVAKLIMDDLIHREDDAVSKTFKQAAIEAQDPRTAMLAYENLLERYRLLYEEEITIPTYETSYVEDNIQEITGLLDYTEAETEKLRLISRTKNSVRGSQEIVDLPFYLIEIYENSHYPKIRRLAGEELLEMALEEFVHVYPVLEEIEDQIRSSDDEDTLSTALDSVNLILSSQNNARLFGLPEEHKSSYLAYLLCVAKNETAAKDILDRMGLNTTGSTNILTKIAIKAKHESVAFCAFDKLREKHKILIAMNSFTESQSKNGLQNQEDAFLALQKVSKESPFDRIKKDAKTYLRRINSENIKPNQTSDEPTKIEIH